MKRTATGHPVEDDRWVHQCRTPAAWDRWFDELTETAEPVRCWPWVVGAVVLAAVVFAICVWATGELP